MLKTLKKTSKALALLIPLTMVLAFGLVLAPATAYGADDFVVTKDNGSLGGFPTLEAAFDKIQDDADEDTEDASYVITCADGDEIAAGITFDDDDGDAINITIKSSEPGKVRNFTLASNNTDRHLDIGTTSGNVTLTLEDISLTGHGSNEEGGGISIGATSEPSKLILKNSTIQKCVGAGTGGGIELINTALTMEGSKIIECYAAIGANTSGQGGGIYGTEDSTITIDKDSVIEKCVASAGDLGIGGGIYLDDTGENKLEINGGNIINNIATLSASYTPSSPNIPGGGGVRMGVNNTFIMNDGEISNNIASKGSGGQGGGIYFNGASTTKAEMKGGIIDNNIASSRDDGKGGGVYVEAGITFDVTGGTISNNTATLRDGGQGGGIYSEDAITLARCTIIGNKAHGESGSGDGGGVYLTTSASLETKNPVEFVENMANAGSGGAIYTAKGDYSNIITTGATNFKNNSAEKAYIYDDSVTDDEIRFKGVSIHFPGSFGIEDGDHVLNNFDINFENGEEFDPFVYVFPVESRIE